MPRRSVMVSSTARDLPQHRQQVRLACEQADFAPHDMMEHLTALNADAIKASLDMVENADVYVGIFAKRYGYVPDGHAISITEMEYERAVALKKPQLIFFNHTDHLFKGDEVETGSGAEKLEALKGRIGKSHVVAFFQSAHDLRGHVVAALTRLRNELDAAETAAASKLDAQHNVTAQAIVDELRRQGFVAKAAEAGVGERAVLELARRLKPDEVLDFDQAVKELTAAVETAVEVMQKGARGSNLDDLVNTVLARIAEKTGAGDIEGAAREADRGFAEWERAEAERRESSLRSGIALLEAGLEQDILRRDAPAAARRVEKIVALEHPDDTTARFAAMRQWQDVFYVRGRDQGINFDLEIAIEIARLALVSAHNGDERGTALNDLGNALQVLGERESGTARLEEAVEAYRAALQEYTRERVPLDWAATQNNLASALQALGARESDTTPLSEAVEAFRAALQEYTRERVPLDWATTQNNLGTALGTLGERENDTARLTEAVEAFRAALQERTRERVPLDWAMTQNNLGNALRALGNALRALGERESGTARLSEAVEAFRAALQESTRERVPLDWAMAQNNLGTALSTLGERESDTARLAEAVEAYRAALQERTRERVPLDWAATQNNLGNALATLGEHESGTAQLIEAVEAFRAALAVFEQANASHYAEMTRRNLAQADALLAARHAENQ